MIVAPKPTKPINENFNGYTKLPAPIKWFGGKGNFLPKLLPIIPYSDAYVEPFAGGGCVFFARERSPTEVYNDLNGDVINLMRVLQDPEKNTELERRLSWTLYARAEKARAKELRRGGKFKDDIERAWTLFVGINQGVGGDIASGWGYSIKESGGGNTQITMWQNKLNNINLYIDRLRHAYIECDDARNIIKRFDAPNTVFYCDPPYLASTRKSGGYAHEMTDADHIEFLEICLKSKGAFVISGYPSELYQDLLSDWEVNKFETVCFAAGRTKNSGLQGAGAAKARQPRTECVWRNARAVELSKKQKGLLF